MKRLERILLFAWVALLFGVFWNVWNGDPTIYFVYAQNLIRGNGLSFNPGYPSASFSSPLWLLIVTIGGANPIVVKLATLMIFTAGIILINRSRGIVAAVLTVYLSFVYCFLGYETSLIVLASGLILSKRENWGYVILTLARPEAILLFPLFKLFWDIRWTSIIPWVVHYAAILAFIGTPASFVARASHAGMWIEVRYILILLPVGLLLLEELINDFGWRKYIVFGVLVVGSLLKLPKSPMDFDSVTYRDAALRTTRDDTVLTTEIQIKYWTEASVVSMDGLLKDNLTPNLYLRTVNDTLNVGTLIFKPKESTMLGLYRLEDK